MLEFNPSSSRHVAALLFGGEIKYVDKEESGVFKTGLRKGEAKYKNVDKVLSLNGLIRAKKEWKTESKNLSTNDKVLTEIALGDYNEDAVEIAKLMLDIRYLDKQLTTYYDAVANLIEKWDGCLHGQLSHCGYESNGDVSGGTSTGRLSSKAPNLQNFPRESSSNVKNYFTSRYKDQGEMIEPDYSQLEVAVFAFLTQDIQLMEDIENGLDIHKELASQLYNKPIEEITLDERQKTKNSTFHVVYGGGAKALAIRVGISEEVASEFINLFYRRYPMAKIWQDNLVKQVECTRQFIDKYTKFNNQIERGWLQSCTGRKYWFETQDSPGFLQKKGIKTSFNPPNIKNYPVQGLATADIVLIMLGRLWRKAIHHRDKFLLVNTVHDSVIIDCKKEYVDFACNFLKIELQCVKEMMKEVFNLDFNVPLKVSIKHGKSWGEVK